MTDLAPTLTLRNNAEIPVIGLGTSPMQGNEAATAVRTALEAGYRLVDTAENYRNEEAVGQGIADSGVDRSEIFITTKFNRNWHSVDGVRGGLPRQCSSGWGSTTRPADGALAESRSGSLRRRPAGSGPPARGGRHPRRSASRTSSRPTCSGCWTRPTSCPT